MVLEEYCGVRGHMQLVEVIGWGTVNDLIAGGDGFFQIHHRTCPIEWMS